MQISLYVLLEIPNVEYFELFSEVPVNKVLLLFSLWNRRKFW